MLKNMANKKTKQKKTYRKTPTINSVDEIHKYINRVQINKKDQKIQIKDFDLVCVVENVIKDSQIKFHKREMKTKIAYILSIGDVDFFEDVDFDEIEDDIFKDLMNL